MEREREREGNNKKERESEMGGGRERERGKKKEQNIPLKRLCLHSAKLMSIHCTKRSSDRPDLWRQLRGPCQLASPILGCPRPSAHRHNYYWTWDHVVPVQNTKPLQFREDTAEYTSESKIYRDPKSQDPRFGGI